MYGDVWVQATLRKIKRDAPGFAVITDVRFPNEADAIHGLSVMSDYPASGHLIRLLRDPNHGTDKHESETGLDNYDNDKYFAIVDNRDMHIAEQNLAIHNIFSAIKGEQYWNLETPLRY